MKLNITIGSALGRMVLLVMISKASGQYGDISDLRILKPREKAHIRSEHPPDRASVLFSARNLANWTKLNGKSPTDWRIVRYVTGVVLGTDNIITKQCSAGKFRLGVGFPCSVYRMLRVKSWATMALIGIDGMMCRN